MTDTDKCPHCKVWVSNPEYTTEYHLCKKPIATFSFACPNCEENISAYQKFIGEKMTCGYCNQSIVIPNPYYSPPPKKSLCPYCEKEVVGRYVLSETMHHTKFVSYSSEM